MKPQAKGRQLTTLRLAFVSLILLGAIVVASGAQAAPVTLNLKDADINALVASIAEITMGTIWAAETFSTWITRVTIWSSPPPLI